MEVRRFQRTTSRPQTHLVSTRVICHRVLLPRCFRHPLENRGWKGEKIRISPSEESERFLGECERDSPFGSVVLIDFPLSTIPYLGNIDLFTNTKSLFPSKLATVLSSKIKTLMSLTSNAYSFGSSFRFLHTASRASCMYIPAVLFGERVRTEEGEPEKDRVGTYAGMVVEICTASVVSATLILKNI